MSKAYPQIQVKPSDDTDIGLSGGPVKPLNKSWREQSGRRKSFGAPSKGWPEFDKEGNVVKRRTDPGIPKTERRKGYGYICYDCAVLAGLGEEFNITLAISQQGRCDICSLMDKRRMGIELARYAALVERGDGKVTKR